MVPGKEAPRHKVLVLRPEDQAADLAALVDHRGLEPVVVPIIRIAPPQEEDLSAIDRLLEEAHEFAWVVFTSANGVAAVVDRARDLGRPLKLGRVAAIGSGTQRRLESRGIRVDWIPSTFTTRAIADELPLVGRQSSTTQESPRVALVRADIADKEMDEALEARGFEVVRINGYRTEDIADDRLIQELEAGVDAIAFTSASTVNAFVRIVSTNSYGAAVCSIGPATSKALRSAGLAVDVEAKIHSTEGLVEAIGKHLGNLVRRAR